MAEYPDEEIIVDTMLNQKLWGLCPKSGDQIILDESCFAGLSKDQVREYGGDFLDRTVKELLPDGWLLKIRQSATLTSDQAEHLIHEVGNVSRQFMPPKKALKWAKRELKSWSRFKRWGGSR